MKILVYIIGLTAIMLLIYYFIILIRGDNK